MKSLVFAALSALVAVQSALGQVSYDLSAAPVTLALTVRSSVAGTYERDPETGREDKSKPSFQAEWAAIDGFGDEVLFSVQAAKASNRRYGNREFLNDLLSAGILPDGTISGWSIVSSRDFSDSLGLEAFPSPKIAAFKKGVGTIELGDYITVDAGECLPMTYREQTPLPARPAKYFYEGPVRLGIKFLKVQASEAPSPFMTGLGTASSALFGYLNDPDDTSTGEILRVPGAFKITQIVGLGQSEGQGFSLLSGSVNFGASKPTPRSVDE
jgi:hypothetical protein